MKLIFLCFLLFGSGTCFRFFDLVTTKLVPALYESETIELFGHNCNYNRVPAFKRLELRYKSSVSCPGWVPFSGHGDSVGRQTSVQRAVTDFVRKVFERGLITKEEASIWLD